MKHATSVLFAVAALVVLLVGLFRGIRPDDLGAGRVPDGAGEVEAPARKDCPESAAASDPAQPGDAGENNLDTDARSEASGEVDWESVLAGVHLVDFKPGPVPKPPFGPRHDALSERARQGDASAAVELLQIYEKCRAAHRSTESLEEAIDYAYNARRLILPGRPPRQGRPIPDSADLTEVEEMLRTYAEMCRGVPVVDAEATRDIYETVASAGYVRLAIRGARELMAEGDPAGALSLYREAWAHGSRTGLTGIAAVIAAWPESEAAPSNLPDPVRGLPSQVARYALKSANLRLDEAVIKSDSDIVARMRQLRRQELDRIRASLLEHQVQEAEQAALELVQGSETCCTPF